MRRFQLGSRVMQLSEVTLARTYAYDWMIRMTLLIIEVFLHIVEPFHRFVGKDMLRDFKYPMKGDTVLFWAVPMCSALLPMAVVDGIYIRRRDIYDLHHAILGLLYSILFLAVITDAVKTAMVRYCPDFFWRCFPDGKDVYDYLGNVICDGEKDVVVEGHRSFLSGHASWYFTGSLYLARKIKAFDGKGHVAKLCLIILPLLVASLIGISRVDDYKHHWQDVFAGCLLGFMVSTFCYLQFFPPPNNSVGSSVYRFAPGA